VSNQARQAVGYAELFEHFARGLDLDETIERIKVSSRRLAKQQRTWLKRIRNIRWIDVEARDEVESVLQRAKPLIG
jgi:tRNA dimethylallyltransferase